MAKVARSKTMPIKALVMRLDALPTLSLSPQAVIYSNPPHNSIKKNTIEPIMKLNLTKLLINNLITWVVSVWEKPLVGSAYPILGSIAGLVMTANSLFMGEEH